jgi:hypothetical protein
MKWFFMTGMAAGLLMAGGAGAQTTALSLPDGPLPKGVPVVTLIDGIVDSHPNQFNNSGNDENKVTATGLGQLLDALDDGTNNKGFAQLKVRTRGHLYGAAVTMGVTEEVTAQLRLRFINLDSMIRHETSGGETIFHDANEAAGFIGAEPLEDAHMDTLLDGELNFAVWDPDEQTFDDGSVYRGALTGGLTYRGKTSVGDDLVEYALGELGRLNRPPYLRFGYKGVQTYDDGDLKIMYGAEAAYHFEGETNIVNPAHAANNFVIATNPAAAAFFGLRDRPLIEHVRSDDHFGVFANINATKDVGNGFSVGGGTWLEYEDGHDLSRVSKTGNPVPGQDFDGARITERKTEWALWYVLSARYNGIAAETVPILADLEWHESFMGRNRSEIQVLMLKISVPLARPDNS